MIKERWLPIVGFEGRYEVSNRGRIKSLNYRGHKGWVEILKPSINYAGYLVVMLGCERIQLRLHCIVLEAFVGPRPLGMEGCHNNSKKVNCSLNNLRWDTPSGNAADRRPYDGQRNPNAKLTDLQREEIKHRRLLGEPLKKLAYEFGITGVRVGQIAKV